MAGLKKKVVTLQRVMVVVYRQGYGRGKCRTKDEKEREIAIVADVSFDSAYMLEADGKEHMGRAAGSRAKVSGCENFRCMTNSQRKAFSPQEPWPDHRPDTVGPRARPGR